MAPSLPAEEQQRLARALREGSPQAFEQLYTQLRGPIYNLAARIVGNRDDAADITQEVFLDAYRQLPTHQGELRLEPWLYRIAVNTCYDHLRRRARRPADSLSDVAEIPATGDEQFRSYLAAAVSQALAGLNPRYRTALVLKDLHGFGNAEIASILGIKSGTAAVLLFRARNAFKQAFREVAPADVGRAGVVGVSMLPTLALPSLLDAPPAFAMAASLAGSVPAAVEVAAGPLAAATAAVGGALAKIGALLTTKAAVAGLGIAALAGGGIAVQTATHPGSPAVSSQDPSPAATVSSATGERQQLIAEMLQLRQCAAATSASENPTAEGEQTRRMTGEGDRSGAGEAGDGGRQARVAGDGTGSAAGTGSTGATTRRASDDGQATGAGEQNGPTSSRQGEPGAGQQSGPGGDATSSGRN